MSVGRTPQRRDTFPEDGVSTENSPQSNAGGSVRIVPTPELAARDDVNSDHLGMDNLSLADVLTEFDVHLVEALGGTKKSTVLQNAAEKQSETKAHHQSRYDTSGVRHFSSSFTNFKGHPVATLNSDIQPADTPSQSRKFVTFSDSVQTYQPTVKGNGSLIYISAGNRLSSLTAQIAPYGSKLPVASSSSPMSERRVTDYDNYETYVRSNEDDDQFFDRINKLRVLQVNDKNVYDDVEFIPRNGDVTSSALQQTIKSNLDGNAAMTSNEDVTTEGSLSDFAVLRTVAIMLAWVLTGLLSGLLCAYLYSWRLHYNVTYEEFSRSFVVEGVGTVLGALLFWATSVCCRSCGDTAIGVAMVMLAAYPCHYNFIYFLTSAFVFGIAKGLLFTASIFVIKHQWDTSKSSICIHILYVSMTVGWFISVHIGRPFFEQILVFTTLSSDGCFGNATVLTSSVNVTDDVVSDVVTADMRNTTSCDVTESSKVQFPIVYIPLAFISLSLAVFFFCLSCCHCCVSRHRTIRMRPAVNYSIDESRRHSTGDVGAENDYIKVEDLRREKATVEQTKGGDGNNNSTAGRSTTELAGRLTEGRSKEAEDEQAVSKGGMTSDSNERHDKSTVRFQDGPDLQSSTSERPTDKQRSAATSKWFQGEQNFDVPILMFLYVFHFIPSGVELGLGRFMSIYAGRNRLLLTTENTKDSLADSVNVQVFDRSVLLVTMFWGAVIFGRFLSVCIGVRRPLISIFFTVSCPVLQFLSAAVLTAYGNQFLSMLWPFVALFGCAIGPVSPGSWTWSDIFLTSESKSVAAGVAVSALGGSVVTWLTGLGVDYYGSTSLWLMASACALLAGIFAVPVVAKLEAYRSRVNEERRRRRPRSTYV